MLTWNCILLRIDIWDMEYKHDTGAGIACSVQWLDSGLGHSGFEFRQGQHEIFFSRKLPEWLWGLHGLLLSGNQGLFARGKAGAYPRPTESYPPSYWMGTRDCLHGAKLGPTRSPEWTQGLCARGKAGAYPRPTRPPTQWTPGTVCTG